MSKSALIYFTEEVTLKGLYEQINSQEIFYENAAPDLMQIRVTKGTAHLWIMHDVNGIEELEEEELEQFANKLSQPVKTAMVIEMSKDPEIEALLRHFVQLAAEHFVCIIEDPEEEILLPEEFLPEEGI